MITGSDIAARALTWLGTPYLHQGRVKGLGVDCVGLVIGVARELGAWPLDYDITGYGRLPHADRLRTIVSAHADAIDAPEVGCIALFRWMREPQHLGILLPDNRVVHAYSKSQGVVSHGLTADWAKRITDYYRLKAVTHG